MVKEIMHMERPTMTIGDVQLYIKHMKTNPANDRERQTMIGVVTDNIDCLGISYCSPLDNFSRKKGIKLALSRALMKSKLDKMSRKKIWNHFVKLWGYDNERKSSSKNRESQLQTSAS